MSADFLAAIAAALLSLGFSYIPSAQGWWESLSANYRKLIMLGLMVSEGWMISSV